MKDRTKAFFSAPEKERIEQAVQQAELRTSGEIVPMVVSESYDYPRAEIMGSGLFSLAAATTLSWAFGGSSVWAFLPIFLLCYFPFKCLIRSCPSLKRRLINPAEIDAEVEEKALVSFLEQGIYRTRDETGILILVSLFERRVHVLADKGINEVVPAHTWEEVVDTIVTGIHEDRAADALCSAIKRCGDLLQQNFPVKSDDTDELPNLITE